MEGAVTGTSNFNSFRASTLNLYIYQRKMDRDIEVLNTELKHGFKILQLSLKPGPHWRKHKQKKKQKNRRATFFCNNIILHNIRKHFNGIKNIFSEDRFPLQLYRSET